LARRALRPRFSTEQFFTIGAASFMTSMCARCFALKLAGALALAGTALAASDAAADATFSQLLFNPAVPVSYAQLTPSGGSLRARVESVPGVALGEGAPFSDIGSAAAAPSQGFRAWAAGFGFTSRVGADERGAGFRTKGGGATVGVDYTFSPTFLAGVALSYTRGETTSLGARGESDTVSGAVYGAWAPYAGWEVEGLLGIDSAEIETRRLLPVVGGQVLTRGDTDALGFSASGTLGYRFRFAAPAGDAFIKPFAGLAYSSQDRDDYTEFGAFGPGLVFPSKTFERGTFNLGAAFGIDLNAGNGWIVRPELRVAWSRYLTDPSPRVPAFFNGTAIVLRDPDPGDDGGGVALEVTAATAGLQLFAGYAGEFRSNAHAHQGRVGLRVNW
jgi:outer membrane autotransporter protein